jgi:CxxC motif-containing protein (DUF1111 family)
MAVRTRALLLLFVLAIRSAEGQHRGYSVFAFHAAGDGKTDDAQVTAAQPHEFLTQPLRYLHSHGFLGF